VQHYFYITLRLLNYLLCKIHLYYGHTHSNIDFRLELRSVIYAVRMYWNHTIEDIHIVHNVPTTTFYALQWMLLYFTACTKGIECIKHINMYPPLALMYQTFTTIMDTNKTHFWYYPSDYKWCDNTVHYKFQLYLLQKHQPEQQNWSSG